MALSQYFNQRTPTEYNFINKLVNLKINREPKNLNKITLENLKEMIDFVVDLDNPPLDLNHRDIGIMTVHLNKKFKDTPPDKAYIDRLNDMAKDREDTTHGVLPDLMFRGGRRTYRRRKSRRTRKYKK
jgi:hypothetical protein